MKPKAETLFHFTKSMDAIKSILKNGLEPKYCLEDIEWISPERKFTAYPMCSFCDIPLSRISEHSGFYGEYGIGLTKEWALKNELNPIVYIPPGGHISKLAHFLTGLDVPGDEEKDKEVLENWVRLMSLVKPIEGKVIVSGEPVKKDFYQENEWRYAPDTGYVMRIDHSKEEYGIANEDIKQYALKISPSDIRYIFVNNDNEIPSLVDFINTEMDCYPLSDIKILQTRIISLSTIADDM